MPPPPPAGDEATGQLLAAESLAALIERDGPLSDDRAVAVAIKVLESLAASHEAGVVHGALGTEHVLIAGDEVRVVGHGARGGDGRDASARDDLRAVGQLMVAMVAGRRDATGAPFTHDRVARAVERARAADPARGFQSAREMTAALATSTLERAKDLYDKADNAETVADLLGGNSGKTTAKALSSASRGKLFKLGIGGLVAAGVVITAVSLPKHERAEPVATLAPTASPPEAAAATSPAPPAPLAEPERPAPPAPAPAEPRPAPQASSPTAPVAPRKPAASPKAPVAPPEPEPQTAPEPTPEPAAPELTSLSYAQINSVMRGSIAAVSRCMGPVPDGTTLEIPVSVVVVSDGSVRAAHLDHPKADCIRPIVEALRFPTFTRPSQTFKYTYRAR